MNEENKKTFPEEAGAPPLCKEHPSGTSTCLTVADLCLDWLRDRQESVKKSTYSTYAYCVTIHILPLIGEQPLSGLGREEILSFLQKIQEKELAETTIYSIFVVFKSILKHGIRFKLISSGLLAYCHASCHRTESRILAVQDSAPMKEYLLRKRSIFAIAILLCRGTGIRIGELCGLKWGDMDFASGTFHIKRTVSRIPNPDTSPGQPKTILYIRTPKSHTSSREIPIPAYLLTPLRRMRKADDFYVLTGKSSCTEPRNVQKRFKTILKRCEMEDCNFHAMRHGFATACLEKGVDCKTVSAILGHASIRTTMDFYVHTSMRQKTDCINGID